MRSRRDKKRGGKNIQKEYSRKIFNLSDNDMVTDLEPDILEKEKNC